MELMTIEQEFKLDEARSQRQTMIEYATKLAASIKDQESCQAAANYGNELYRWVKVWEAKFKKAKDDAFQSHKNICRLEDEIVGQAKEAIKKIIDPKVIAWKNAEDALRRREAEKAAEEARQREEEARLAQAVELEQSGQKEVADALIEEPVAAPAVAPRPVAIPNQTIKTRWEAVVTNKLELIKAVAEGRAPANALDVNQTFLNNEADNYKKEFRMPGVEARPKQGITRRF